MAWRRCKFCGKRVFFRHRCPANQLAITPGPDWTVQPVDLVDAIPDVVNIGRTLYPVDEVRDHQVPTPENWLKVQGDIHSAIGHKAPTFSDPHPLQAEAPDNSDSSAGDCGGGDGGGGGGD